MFWRGALLGIAATVLLLLALHWLTARFATIGPKQYYGQMVTHFYPENWSCQRDGRATICLPDDDTPQSGAVIISATQDLAVDDSFDAFEERLRTERAFETEDGQTHRSSILEVARRQINGHPWVVGKHIGAELPNFETHYFATIFRTYSILVTFSFHVDETRRYRDVSRLIENSLQLF